MTSKNVGQEKFIWFVGKVEDRDDPLMMGRVRVRVFNLHPTENTVVQTKDLPWAVPITSINSPSLKGTGTAPIGLQKGSYVFGFFMDGNEQQLPIIWGSYNKVPGKDINNSDAPKESIGINSLNKEPKIGPEPESAFAARYPYNQVTKTEGGHVIEIDSTPNNERIHIFHPSGTYEEWNNEGRRVQKIVGDDFEIIKKDKTVHIEGNVKVYIKGNVEEIIDGNVTRTVKGNYSESVEGSYHIKTNAVNVDAKNLIASDNLTVGSGATGSFTTPTGQTITVQEGIITNIF